ncbi:MAG: FKBP-type peptidyl-prolyl cis-trans isomerase [Bacteroidales bacterium]|jgi:FKBP-type peptidyl-prolyl cis-trans isomerase SlyD|nr:FKBP-type peptidyl-prolyl cis-trans isomerase [Bacteroidales bacterium]MDD3160622.1 FKBP-type peptidyl-prolyl cis-trans isomerase [Bacteroidales bacterium]
MKIELGKFVSVAYDLYSAELDENGELELLEQAPEDKPFSFIFGTQQVLDTFESELVGKKVGESFDFELTPDMAYGDYEDERVVDVPKGAFEIDGEFDETSVYPNAVLPMMDSQGNHMYGSVVDITADAVKMDFNHPFAGETLHFKGKVLEVRDATLDELNPKGCSGCGCDCEDDAEGGCTGGCASGCASCN